MVDPGLDEIRGNVGESQSPPPAVLMVVCRVLLDPTQVKRMLSDLNEGIAPTDAEVRLDDA
jgi:hypothetical protein